MGSVCCKEVADNNAKVDDNSKEREVGKPSVLLAAPTPVIKEEDAARKFEYISRVSNAKTTDVDNWEKKTQVSGKRGSSNYQRWATMEPRNLMDPRSTSKILSMPRGHQGDSVIAGWPHWLTSAAGDAITGLIPRRADTFEKLDKIGQGTYSSVYRARDLESGNIVAMKKVRFVNMDPESVRFMAREIHILRKLNHPNIMKLEAIVTSRMSSSLYLVFEYMDHDLAGLAAAPGVKFTEPQIKCYMWQLFKGLQHCHRRGVLHRDIKGSNLLIDANGVLKIADFGLATLFDPNHRETMTSRVVTLWYRAPELLLGATEYGIGIDMWSSGCILAELFAGKPIMPGRTEVEQIHKIFKLCGSPAKDYWQRMRLSQATSFRPQNSYKRCITDTFKNFPPSALALVDKLLSIDPESRGSASSALESEFFRTAPLPCDPSSIPKYPPSKELHAKIREEARRRKAEAVKGQRPESGKKGPRDMKNTGSPDFIPHAQAKKTSTSYKYDIQEDAGSGFPIEPPRGANHGRFSHTSSTVHPCAMELNLGSRTSTRHSTEYRYQKHQLPQATVDICGAPPRKQGHAMTDKDSTGYVPRKNVIRYSGPLMPPGNNLEDLLKEHERQIQHAVRKARLEKSATKDSIDACDHFLGR